VCYLKGLVLASIHASAVKSTHEMYCKNKIHKYYVFETIFPSKRAEQIPWDEEKCLDVKTMIEKVGLQFCVCMWRACVMREAFLLCMYIHTNAKV